MMKRQGFCSECQCSGPVHWTKQGWKCTFCGEIIPDDMVDTDEDMKAEEEWEKNQKHQEEFNSLGQMAVADLSRSEWGKDGG